MFYTWYTWSTVTDLFQIDNLFGFLTVWSRYHCVREESPVPREGLHTPQPQVFLFPPQQTQLLMTIHWPSTKTYKNGSSGDVKHWKTKTNIESKLWFWESHGVTIDGTVQGTIKSIWIPALNKVASTKLGAIWHWDALGTDHFRGKVNPKLIGHPTTWGKAVEVLE